MLGQNVEENGDIARHMELVFIFKTSWWRCLWKSILSY